MYASQHYGRQSAAPLHAKPSATIKLACVTVLAARNVTQANIMVVDGHVAYDKTKGIWAWHHIAQISLCGN